MSHKFAVLSTDDIPADGVGVVQLDDGKLVDVMAAVFSKHHLKPSREFLMDLAEQAIEYMTEQCESAHVKYA